MTKILLVEDDKSLREIYGVRLLAEGYDIVSAGDGEEALAMAIKERPALIVSDVMMPKISGFDMLDILRSTTETKDIKVIMMTALSSEDQRQRGERLGADRYLVKSQVGIEDVVRTVHEVLGDLPGMAPAPQPAMQNPTPDPTPQQQQPVMPALVAPQQPQNQTPQAPPAASQPVATQQASSQNGLPQPTAPFSSATPRPNNLADRVIQPLQANGEGSTDKLASLMEQELTGISTEAPSPTPNPPADQSHDYSAQMMAEPQRPDAAALSPQPQQPVSMTAIQQSPVEPAPQPAMQNPVSHAQNPMATPYPQSTAQPTNALPQQPPTTHPQ